MTPDPMRRDIVTAESTARTSVVALGGGHGLYASLSALSLLDVDVTAVVTVADDGGSSGRIRRELGLLPPGDLRMALAALATSTVGQPALLRAEGAAPIAWRDLLQHRLGGYGALAGHPVGNILLSGLMELHDDPVAALDELACMVGARGRVLPMSTRPLDLVASVISIDPDDPVRHRRIRGQSSIASTPGRVSAIEVHPTDAPACAEALAAISSADAVLLGPGSWFTSVIPHLLVTDLAQALIATRARVVVVLNLEPQVGETDGFSAAEHLHALTEVCPMLHVDAVIADPDALDDEWELRRAVEALSARLVIRAVAEAGSTARHDPIRLAAAIAEATGLPGSAPDHNQQAIGQMRQGNEGAP